MIFDHLIWPCVLIAQSIFCTFVVVFVRAGCTSASAVASTTRTSVILKPRQNLPIVAEDVYHQLEPGPAPTCQLASKSFKFKFKLASKILS